MPMAVPAGRYELDQGKIGVGRNLVTFTKGKLGTIEVEAGLMSEADTAKALVYTINRFCDESAGEFTVRELSEGFSSMASEIVERRNKFVEMINQGSFDVAFQPICDMQTGRPHHFEALVRFVDSTTGAALTSRTPDITPDTDQRFELD